MTILKIKESGKRLQTKQKRIWAILDLTLILGLTVGFLLQTSQDVRWGGGFWETWLATHWRLPSGTAHQLVFWFRKTAHFIGYGCLSLLFWRYFYLWGIRRLTAGLGLTATVLIAVLDEYTQASSNFRSGQPADVLLDCCGGAVFIVLALIALRRRRQT
jgi:VanZ family protein